MSGVTLMQVAYQQEAMLLLALFQECLYPLVVDHLAVL